MSVAVLEMRGIVKEFPGIRALDDVSLTLAQGEVLALVGENGAGKSTLMKVLSGVYPAGTFSGTILRAGEAVRFRGTRDAERHGIAIIHQELNLLPELTVMENLFLGAYPRRLGGLIDWKAMRRGALDALSRLGVTFSPERRLGELSVGDGQMVEIARALMKHAKVLIFDEPTSALSGREIERLYGLMAEEQSRGTAMVYISHKLDEVYKLCRRAVVLRDGKSVGGGQLSELTRDRLITLMAGRELSALYPQKLSTTAAAPGLALSDVSVARVGSGKQIVKGVSFKAFPGEVLGIGGMMGSGRTELLMGLMGHPDFVASGRIEIAGKEVPAAGVAGACYAGLGLVTEDRKQTGLHCGMTIRENIVMAALEKVSRHGILSRVAERLLATRYMERLRVKAPTVETAVGQLSGGNQQKVAIAKWAAREPRVMLLDEPTRGVDVAAKFEIYSLLNELAASGVTVVIVSSELPELVGVCQRVAVMREGRLTGTLSGADVTAEAILRLAVGGSA